MSSRSAPHFGSTTVSPARAVEVIVAARRPAIDRLLQSLARQTVQPDLVRVISNEVRPRSNYGLKVELVRFWSWDYAVGVKDVVLRRNIGIWESDAELLVFQDDDQIASPTMVEACIERTANTPFVWGHHRYLDFDGRSVEEIMLLPPGVGRSRERVANTHHGWYSCYAGMMASRRDFLLDVGGFDMQFMGGHAGEDQQLGRRMLAALGQSQPFIAEPPFAWHPEGREEYLDGPSNLCPDGFHVETTVWYNGVEIGRCTRCPYQVYRAGRRDDDNRVAIPYEHSRVQLKKEFI